VITHAVKLCLKSPEKILEYSEYDSYTQIFCPELEETEFAEFGVFDDILDIFLILAGSKFIPTLSLLKFTKIGKLFKNLGNKSVDKSQIELCYKKMLLFHESMDFYAFVDSVEFLLNKCFPKSEDLEFSAFTKGKDKCLQVNLLLRSFCLNTGQIPKPDRKIPVYEIAIHLLLTLFLLIHY
jgi:hypothetical protein